MGTVDDYIASLNDGTSDLFGQMAAIVGATVPSLGQGVSYQMPCFLYRGKPLVSFIERKKHLALYPYSGKVIESVRLRLGDFPISEGSGSIHFSRENPIPEDLLVEIVLARVAEIDK